MKKFVCTAPKCNQEFTDPMAANFHEFMQHPSLGLCIERRETAQKECVNHGI